MTFFYRIVEEEKNQVQTYGTILEIIFTVNVKMLILEDLVQKSIASLIFEKIQPLFKFVGYPHS